jgi:hypothetical protein
MSTLEMTRGDQPTFFVGPVRDRDGAIVDITGTTLWWTAKAHIRDEDEDALIAKTTADGISIPLGSDGLATITLERADTDSFPETTVLYWDLQEVDGIDVLQTLARGRIVVHADVTRAEVVAGS